MKNSLFLSASFVILTTSFSAQAYYFWDQGLVQGTVNTSYQQRNIGTSTNPLVKSYCLYDSNSPSLTPQEKQDAQAKCERRLKAPAVYGNQDLSWSQHGAFGASRYWVLDINNEPSEHTCNYGPPSLSAPRSDPGHGVFGFTVLKDTPINEYFYRAHLVMNLSHFNPCNAADIRDSAPNHAIPYMSIGASDVRGNGGPVGALNPSPASTVPSKVSFTAKLWDYSKPNSYGGQYEAGGAYFRVLALSQWKDSANRDVPRMLFINLFYEGNHYGGKTVGDGFVNGIWNWPYSGAMYFPGGDIAYMDADMIASKCGGYSVRRMKPSDLRADINYTIDLQKLFKCASDNGLFHDSLPTTSNVHIRAVHWAVEGFGINGGLWTSVHNMRMTH